MDKAKYLNGYLHAHIPISKGMGIKVLEANDGKVILEAPLSPNVNHQGTVFGGSAASIAVLSAWSLLHIKLLDDARNSNIVVHKAAITYHRPIAGSFTSTTVGCKATEWRKFLAAFHEHGRARIKLTSVLHFDGEKVAELEGDFVAMNPKD